LIFACIETIIGMILLRTSLLSIPLDGFILDVMSRWGFNLTLVVPKFAPLFFSLMVLLAGLLTLFFMPTGRMLNIFFCGSAFLITTFTVLLLKVPELDFLRLSYLLFVACTLIGTGIVFLILTHPGIKTQFNIKKVPSSLQTLKRTLWLAFVCFFIFSALNYSIKYYPNAYDVAHLNKIYNNSIQLGNINLEHFYQKIISKLPIEYE